MIRDGHEGQRKRVRCEHVDDSGDILVGEDAEDEVLPAVIGEQRSEGLRRFDIVRSIEPGFRRSSERAGGKFLEAGGPSSRRPALRR